MKNLYVDQGRVMLGASHITTKTNTTRYSCSKDYHVEVIEVSSHQYIDCVVALGSALIGNQIHVFMW